MLFSVPCFTTAIKTNENYAYIYLRKKCDWSVLEMKEE